MFCCYVFAVQVLLLLSNRITFSKARDNRRLVRKSTSMHGRKSTPKFLGTAKAFFCLPRGPKFSNFFDLDLHWVSVVRVLFDLFSDVGFSKDRGRNCHKAITFVFFWESSGVAWGHFRENGKVL